jgi:hypothetical protein
VNIITISVHIKPGQRPIRRREPGPRHHPATLFSAKTDRSFCFMVRRDIPLYAEGDTGRTRHGPVGVSARPSTWTSREIDEARTHRGQSPGLHTTGRTPCGDHARTDDAFPLSVRGAYAMAGARPTPSRAWRHRAPDEGRCRADPHCTNDGHRRHHRNDHRYFDIEHPASTPDASAHRHQFRAATTPRIGRMSNTVGRIHIPAYRAVGTNHYNTPLTWHLRQRQPTP